MAIVIRRRSGPWSSRKHLLHPGLGGGVIESLLRHGRCLRLRARHHEVSMRHGRARPCCPRCAQPVRHRPGRGRHELPPPDPRRGRPRGRPRRARPGRSPPDVSRPASASAATVIEGASTSSPTLKRSTCRQCRGWGRRSTRDSRWPSRPAAASPPLSFTAVPSIGCSVKACGKAARSVPASCAAFISSFGSASSSGCG